MQRLPAHAGYAMAYDEALPPMADAVESSALTIINRKTQTHSTLMA